MTTIYFTPAESIIVPVILFNNITTTASMVFDTGASRVMISKEVATKLHVTINTKQTNEIITASKIENVPTVIIPKVSILGATVENVEALVKDLPQESYVEGLLGLNFIKHFDVHIDFKHGKLTMQKN